MKKFILVKVPIEATEISINNVGCVRYSHNQGKESAVIEPNDIGVYLEEEEHKIVGGSITETTKTIVIEINEPNPDCPITEQGKGEHQKQ